MYAIDIMTRDVVTATPDTPVAELIRLMLARHIGAVPIVDGDRLVGIVTESDLIRRPELHTERRHFRWLWLFRTPASLAEEYVQSHGRHAGEVMAPDVVTVQDTTPADEIAALMERHGIKRLPVLRNGRLAGIVSRTDLMRALACRITDQVTMDDRRIRDAVLAELRSQPWGGEPAASQVTVRDGVVHLWGVYGAEAEHRARIVAAETIPGVREVVDHMEHWSPPDPLDRPNWPSPAPP